MAETLTFANLTTAASLALFIAASGYGIAALRHRTPYRETILFITFVAVANAAFRAFTLWHRLHDEPLPQPFSTNTALVLQVGLAVSLLLIAAVARLSAKTQPPIVGVVTDGTG